MSTYSTPELVAAVMSERRRTAEAGRVARATRLARERCARASSGLRARLLGRRSATC